MHPSVKKMSYRFLAPPCSETLSSFQGNPKTVEKHSHSSMPRPDCGATQTLRNSPRSEAMFLRRFQSVIGPTNPDALSGRTNSDAHDRSASRRPSRSEAPLQAVTSFKLDVPSKNTSQLCFCFCWIKVLWVCSDHCRAMGCIGGWQ